MSMGTPDQDDCDLDQNSADTVEGRDVGREDLSSGSSDARLIAISHPRLLHLIANHHLDDTEFLDMRIEFETSQADGPRQIDMCEILPLEPDMFFSPTKREKPQKSKSYLKAGTSPRKAQIALTKLKTGQ
jgi:hypothetical protein